MLHRPVHGASLGTPWLPRPDATAVAPKLGSAPGNAAPIGAQGTESLVAGGDVRHVLQLLGFHGDLMVISRWFMVIDDDLMVNYGDLMVNYGNF